MIGHLDLWRRNVTEEADIYLGEERKEIMDKTRSSASEMIEFRPGRDPREAIEGDLIRFLHKDHDNNSVSWVQGRLVSRIDKLEDAVRTEWTMNRFTVDITSTINYWGDPGILPSSATVNISYGTKWALGFESSQLSNTDKRLSLGYHEVVYMGLTKQEPESGEGPMKRSLPPCIIPMRYLWCPQERNY